ncbi:opioid growth factor receptor-related protein [Brevundimonas sp.]|uniref:opioid growth factor receptor-related protein n=1 Tax=Brevundimonas sp. TaxID=1871086 RepID=UPI002D392DD3|nr:opioid growth factor receptor-related protein [Brevundimonas sp.]HYD28724.1 opioid growth factor receptor-related protein [Brevundimonas sp.]
MTVGPILAFLEGEGPDGRGRTLFDVLGFDDAALELNHDFIQWLFPLPEPSGAMPDAPVLTTDDMQAIHDSILAQCALAAATDRMEAFYRATHGWLRPHDHNHLRITRIIRSLRLLRGDEEADAFRSAILSMVEATRAPVSARSRGYWTTA